ncbi:MAG TPA: 16S rRNA (adenine(1518)-N(6)/adenine(1519)-N(6))-dimethyltransferase RsmA [Anaerolineales bacterium]|nr:16S rRNA (adenine(1518)-N(6)/adenine(1519)-N(6))-dimethyltransferase RsmA [Anaerolineales bacterium]
MDYPLRPSELDITGLLRTHGLRPDKRLGQNFLIDSAALERIVRAAEIGNEETILEIGPGLGSLTRYLAPVARSVVTVELDSDLIPILKEVLHPYPNVQLIEGDILKLDPGELMGRTTYLIVANIPYNITSTLLRHLLEARHRPQRMVLTVQREVAERIIAGPGKMSLLSLGVQVYGRPSIAARIPAGAFYPVPKVDSAVVRVDLYPQLPFTPEQLGRMFQIARAGFSQKRKTLRNALAAGLALKPGEAAALLREAGIDPQRRAETLHLDEWVKLEELYLELDLDGLRSRRVYRR